MNLYLFSFLFRYILLISDCLSAGTYSSAGAAECSLCPAGSSCSDPAQSPQACATGYYSLTGVVSTSSKHYFSYYVLCNKNPSFLVLLDLNFPATP